MLAIAHSLPLPLPGSQGCYPRPAKQIGGGHEGGAWRFRGCAGTGDCWWPLRAKTRNRAPKRRPSSRRRSAATSMALAEAYSTLDINVLEGHASPNEIAAVQKLLKELLQTTGDRIDAELIGFDIETMTRVSRHQRHGPSDRGLEHHPLRRCGRHRKGPFRKHHPKDPAPTSADRGSVDHHREIQPRTRDPRPASRQIDGGSKFERAARRGGGGPAQRRQVHPLQPAHPQPSRPGPRSSGRDPRPDPR